MARWGKKLRRAVFLAVFLACTTAVAVAVAGMAGIGAYEKWTWSSDPAEKVLEANCGKCHSYDRPKTYAKSPREWHKTVEEMARRFDIKPDRQVTDAIEALLVRKRSMTPKQAFEYRCGKCHETSVINPYMALAPAALELLIKRHVVEYNYAVEVWQGEMAFDYLKSIRPGGLAADPETAKMQVLYEQDCRVCHTVTFCYKSIGNPPRTEAQWSEIVERMRQKAPNLIKEEDVPILLRRIESLTRGEGK